MPGSFCAVTRPRPRNILTAAALMAMLAAGCDPPPTSIPPGQGQAPAVPLPKEAVNQPPPAPIELTERDAGAPSRGAASGAASGSPGRGSGSQGGTGAAPGTGTAAPGTRPAPGAGAGSSGSGAAAAGAATGKGVRDGGSCERGEQCASGICEGFGCGGDRRGTCMSRNRSCTRDLRPFCGCDGKTFQASGSCPGRRFSARRACR